MQCCEVCYRFVAFYPRGEDFGKTGAVLRPIHFINMIIRTDIFILYHTIVYCILYSVYSQKKKMTEGFNDMTNV